MLWELKGRGITHRVDIPNNTNPKAEIAVPTNTTKPPPSPIAAHNRKADSSKNSIQIIFIAIFLVICL